MSSKQRWWFDNKSSRKKLSKDEVRYWANTLPKLLKVGVELEYNLPDQAGDCSMNDKSCPCVAIFDAKNPMEGTTKCFQQCAKWDMSLAADGSRNYPKDGNCEIAKEHGCAGEMCAAFKSPCSACSKYDRGCSGCSRLYNIHKKPSNIRKRITAKLQPTKFVGDYGTHGVYQVVKDGSLLGDEGIEVVTVGRRPEFTSLHSMIKGIMDLCEESGAYVDERCSIHIHLLASYLNSEGGKQDTNDKYLVGNLTELERAVPEIILANFHQLVRRYQNALIWMGSSGTSLNSLTRWEKYRKPVSPFSALRKNMERVGREVSSSCYKPKYGLINYNPVKYNDDGDVSTLHVEARYLDGMMSAAAVASHAMLIYGLMLKAVDLSLHGTLMSGTTKYMNRQKDIYAHLCNGDGGWGSSRRSDNSGLAEFIPELKEQSKELVRLVKSALVSHQPSGDILSALGEVPVSLRRVEGFSWKDIEEQLMACNNEEQSMPDTLQELIDTSYISGCKTQESWAEKAALEIAASEGKEKDKAYLKQNESSINGFLKRCVGRGDIIWSEDIGTFIRRY